MFPGHFEKCNFANSSLLNMLTPTDALLIVRWYLNHDIHHYVSLLHLCNMVYSNIVHTNDGCIAYGRLLNDKAEDDILY